MFVACSQNLCLDLLEPTEGAPGGTIKFNYLHPEDMPPDASCALDVADRGEHTLEEIAAVMRISDEWVRVLSWGAIAKLEERGGADLRDAAEADRRTEDPEMAAKKAKARNGVGKLTGIPKGAVERRRYTERLPCPIDPSQVAKKAAELASVIRRRELVLEDKRAANAKYREQLSHFNEQLKKLAAAVEDGKELREVECVDYLLPNNEIQKYRTDTGTVITMRTATADELQEKLPGTDDDDDDDEDDEDADTGDPPPDDGIVDDDYIPAAKLRGKQPKGTRDARPGDGG